MAFASLGLSPPLLQAIAGLGYGTPTPIQHRAIPPILAGRDVMAAAQTGTGKTAAFLLPLLEQLAKGERARSNQARALILVPTRELAVQVCDSAIAYGKYLNLRALPVYGGVKINPQMMSLRKGADVLVATPGRLLDLYRQNAVGFRQLEVLVLDEADRMLDLGFADEIRSILAVLPLRRQNLMFSATFSSDIRSLAKGLMRNPLEISTSPPNTAAKTVRQWLCPVDRKRKPALLTALVREHNWPQLLVFTKTREGADQLTRHLETTGITATAIHGDKSQGARTKALGDFRAGLVRALVATDVASRGLDIDELPVVVNFDLPKVAEDYVHRIGRTGRSGTAGEAISLVSADEFELLSAIERLLQKALPREEMEGFEPRHNVPESKTVFAALKPKKPKKPRPQNKPQKLNQGKAAVTSSAPVNRGENRSKNSQGKKQQPGKFPKGKPPLGNNAGKKAARRPQTRRGPSSPSQK